MNTRRFGELEVLCQSPAKPTHQTPLLFVHGVPVRKLTGDIVGQLMEEIDRL